MNSEVDNTHTHLTALCPGLPGWAGTRKVKPIWILLEQETVSGSGISWTICKSARCSRQITTPAPTTQFFYRPDALPAAQPTVSMHWRQTTGGENTKRHKRVKKIKANYKIESFLTIYVRYKHGVWNAKRAQVSIVLYFKLRLCLLYVAYCPDLFSFVSFSVCCGMTLGAAVCHVSY